VVGGAGFAGVADVQSVTIDPFDAAHVYAAGFDGIFISTDAGVSWTRRADLPGAWQVVASPRPGRAVYAVSDMALFRTIDGGLDWDVSYPDLVGSTLGLRVVAAGPSDLYLGPVGLGVLRGRFGENEYTPVNTGLAATWAESLATDPVDDGVVYAGTLFGPTFKSADGATGWTELPIGDVRLLAVAPGPPASIWAAGLGTVTRSTDGGASWARPVTVGHAPNALTALAVDPTSPLTAYAAANAEGSSGPSTG